MVEGDYKLEDVNIMRNSMKEEGWQESEYLPEYWLFKFSRKSNNGASKNESTSIDFLTVEGQRLGSYLMAMKNIEGNPKYGEEDAQKIRQLMEVNSRNARLELANKGAENSIPEGRLPLGWRLLESGPRRFLLSPDGQQFNGRRRAYEHMVQAGYSRDQLNDMRQCMEAEGWKPSKHLPENWLFRFSPPHSIYILNTEGDSFASYVAAIKYMEGDKKYSEDDIKGVNNLLEENTKTWRKLDGNNEADSNMPEGWKVRQLGRVAYVVSPEGEQFGSRRKALEKMVGDGMAQGDVEKMRTTLVGEGWEQSELLPSDWRFKMTDKSKDCAFLMPNAEVIRGKDNASKNLNSTEELRALEVFMEQRTIIRRQNGYTWDDDDSTLPPGWRSRDAGKR